MAPDAPPRFALEVLRARHGDCLLLHHGSDRLLIDGGPAGTYEESLAPRLEQLAAEAGGPLHLRMIMVSHIDDDHIVGLADMLADAREREQERRGPRSWLASEMWFNAFERLTGDGEGGDARRAGARTAALEAVAAAVPGGQSRAITTSVRRAVALRDDARGLGIPINGEAEAGLVLAPQDGPARLEVLPGLHFTVVAPTRAQLEKLRVEWQAWEAEHDRRADARAAAELDRSIYNLSSIVVLAESAGRTMLLTGDARLDHVLDGLRTAGRVTDGAPRLTVDVLKMPHHGSARNVDAEFLSRVRARHYVISADGRDGNPDDAALEAICEARSGDREPWTLWLTYGGRPGDGRDGLHERLDAFLRRRRDTGQALDVRFGSAGESQTIAL